MSTKMRHCVFHVFQNPLNKGLPVFFKESTSVIPLYIKNSHFKGKIK